MSRPYVIRTNGSDTERGKPAVGIAVGEGVGENVTGMEASHVIETPAAALMLPDVKRMNMLPDMAVWMVGMAVPLKLPESVPVADVPS